MRVDVIGKSSNPYSAPSVLWANIPNPLTVPGQLRTVIDVGPAPGIVMQAAGSKWRPFGGRQLLAMRNNNPVTIQNTAGAVAETIGPFPGGLVRAGMQIWFDGHASMAGAGTVARTLRVRVGPSLPLSDAGRFINVVYNGNSAANGDILLAGIINILSDVSAAHRGGPANINPYGGGGFFYSPVIDFSAPWYADILLFSANETAVNITNATWSAGVATYTATAHTLATGDKTTIAAITPSGYNQVGIVTVIDANTFTMPLAANPGTYTSGGTSSRISNMISQSYALWLIG